MWEGKRQKHKVVLKKMKKNVTPRYAVHQVEDRELREKV